VEIFNQSNLNSNRYAYRGIIPPLQHFLNGLSAHPSKWLPSIAKKLVTLLDDLPRAISCTPSQFAVKRREWIRLLGIFRTEFDGLPPSAKQEDWYPHLSDILEIFEGDELVIKRIGREFGLGWLEIVCVWGLWGDEQLERQHLP
jgi:nuclear pore complex protein Nup85